MNAYLRMVLWAVVLSITLFVLEVWLSYLPVARYVFFLPLLLVLIMTVLRGFSFGLGSALLAGWLMSLLSTFPPILIISAFSLAVATSWLISQRILSTRSLASFTATVASGTAAYYGTIMVGFLLLRLFQPNLAVPHWPPWLLAAGFHIITHPIIAAIVWVSSGRTRQYATTTLQSTTSF